MEKENELYKSQLTAYCETIKNLISECDLEIELSKRQIAISQKNIKLNMEQKGLYLDQLLIASENIESCK